MSLAGPLGRSVPDVCRSTEGVGARIASVSAPPARLRLAVRRSAELVITAGANAADIEDARANNGFAYAPAIAVGAIVAGAFV